MIPSYENFKAKGIMWDCPNDDRDLYGALPTPGSSLCSMVQNTVTGATNPTCGTLGAGGTITQWQAPSPTGCCCPRDGCVTAPRFNWILGACRGETCGAYDLSWSSGVNWAKDMGSQLVVNYVAAYNWNNGLKQWEMADDASFNVDGSAPAYDTMKPNGGMSPEEAWMAPQPGGAADWSYGYYPAGAKGVGPGTGDGTAMMFVLSTEFCWNMTWYMLNQLSLDRGPAAPIGGDICSGGTFVSDNCWASGNAGEMDFLEAMWTTSGGNVDGYRRLYSTSWNQVGRGFIGSNGQSGLAGGGWWGNHASTSYFISTDPQAYPATPEPMIFAAVVDKRGATVYQMDGTKEIWPGLTRKTAASTLKAVKPGTAPNNTTAPAWTGARSDIVALFVPFDSTPTTPKALGGSSAELEMNPEANWTQGYCNNWWQYMDDTEQWRWGSKPAVIGGKTMEWNVEMEATAPSMNSFPPTPGVPQTIGPFA